MTFELGGKRDIRRETALAGERAAEWALGEALWSARAEVRSALLDVAFANASLVVDGDEARLAREYLDWVDTRLRYGDATTAERLAAVQVLNESTSRRELDAVELARASAKLAAAIGVTSTELAAAQPVLPPLAGVPPIADADVSAARDLALVNRLDVRHALEQYAIAEQDLRAAVATQYPDLTLAPGYLLDQADHKITLGLDLPVPLFHGANAAIQRAIAERAVAAARFDDTQAGALVRDRRGGRGVPRRARRARGRRARRARRGRHGHVARAAARGRRRESRPTARGRNRARGPWRSTLTARRALLDAVTALEQGIERPLYPASQIDASSSCASCSSWSRRNECALRLWRRRDRARRLRGRRR